MSREEHYIRPSKVTSNKGVYYHNKAVDNCFDEFESRTCGKCKWGEPLNSGPYCVLMGIFDMKYCSKFVSTDIKSHSQD